MAGTRNTLRLFAAVYPPAETARAMLAAVGGLDLPPHRLTPTGQVHMTMHFIGDTPFRQLEAVKESLAAAVSGLPADELTPQRLITLPARGPARLVAAETNGPPTLLEMQRRLVQRLAREVRPRPGDRFLPHLTLCRFRSPSRVGPLEAALNLAAFPVTALKLMKSTLRPTGAVHEEIAVFTLENPAR